MEGGIVGHPVIGPPAGVLPALEALAIAAQSHGNDADAPGLAPRVRRQVDVEQRAVGRPIRENLLDDANRVLGGVREIEVLGKLERHGDARDLEEGPLDRRGDRT